MFVDVLRATTTLVAVGGAGCKGIVVDKKPSRGNYAFVPPFFKDQEWVFGGELNGSPIQGTDAHGNLLDGVISNSPLSVNQTTFGGKYLRFFSTNGAAAFQALSKAKFSSIFALSLANIEATANALIDAKPERIWIVGGGFYGGATIEDSVAAGFLIRALLNRGFASREDLDDEAETMRIHALHFQARDKIRSTELASRLRNGQVAKLLTGIGQGKDVNACISGAGMLGTWRSMAKIALACRDHKKKLLVPEVWA